MEKVYLIILLLLGLISISSLIYIGYVLYFAQFKIEKHPYLRNLIDSILRNIAKKENIYLEITSLENLKKKYKKDAVGLYITASDQQLKIVKKILKGIENIEKHYNLPIAQLYKKTERKEEIKKSDYQLPKIVLAKKRKNDIYYFYTFAHELGHHFSKKINNNPSEESADIYAQKIIYEKLPSYFKLFYELYFSVIIPKNKRIQISIKERLQATFEYFFKYYIHKKKLNKNIIQ